MNRGVRRIAGAVGRGLVNAVSVLAVAGYGACGGAVVLNSTGDGGDAAGGASGGGGIGNSGSAGSGGSAGAGGDVATPSGQDGFDKIDILFVIDNSPSMADMQTVLALAVSDLLDRLVAPRCIADNTGQPVPGLGLACPSGSSMEFKPLADIHVGIVSSSLGGHGSDACDPNDTTLPGNHNNDQGHLLSRTASGTAQTWNVNSGFLAWDPAGTANTPPGESNATNLFEAFHDIVVDVGQTGCGFASPLEAWYRFLIDPQPPLNITGTVTQAGPQPAQLSGLDQTVLDQRKAFLRPDSLVLVVLLSDADDCSLIENNGVAYLTLNSPPNGGVDWIPSGTSPCHLNPNDPCCFNCGSSIPAECNGGNYDVSSDPQCAGNFLTDENDNFSLRCFDQKRKYGIDFLYPVQRYIDGLTQTTIQQRDGQMVVNPLFADLQCGGGADCKPPRSKSLVYFAGIVGVPWQDIAADPKDLTKGFLSSQDLAKNNVWSVILGDPTASPPVPPTDPLMIATPFPRLGTNPVTKQAPAGISAGPGANSINGHEYDTSQTVPPIGDLQYACIFDLPQPRDCSLLENQYDCDCGPDPDPSALRNPVCQDAQGNYGTTQLRAKAYPGVRELQVLKGIGDQGIVASICPAQLNNQDAADFGYRQSFGAVVNRLKTNPR